MKRFALSSVAILAAAAFVDAQEPATIADVVAALDAQRVGTADRAPAERCAAATRHHAAAVRRLGLRGLGLLGTDAGDHADAVLLRLRDADAAVRRAAARTIGAVEPALAEAGEDLVALVEPEPAADESEWNDAIGVGGGGAGGIFRHPPVPPPADLRAALAGASDKDRVTALKQIGARSQHRELLDDVLPLLGAADARVFAAAIGAVMRIASGDAELAAPTVAPARRRLGDESAAARRAAAIAFARFAPHAELGKLAPLTKDPRNRVRKGVLDALATRGNVDPASRPAVEPLLRPFLQDRLINLRRDAAFALAYYPDATPETLAALTGALADRSDQVAMFAAQSLGKIGARATDSLDALRRLFDERGREPGVRKAALRAAARIAPARPGVLRLAVQALRDRDEEIRAAAAALWGDELGPEGR